MIVAKLNVKLIDKARLFKGEKGIYLDIGLIETPQDQYGNDYMVVQQVTKNERLAGVKGAILGNAKIIGGARAPAKADPKPTKPTTQENLDEDVHF